MATHSSILAWRIPGTEEPGGATRSPWGSQSQTRLKRLSTHERSELRKNPAWPTTQADTCRLTVHGAGAEGELPAPGSRGVLGPSLKMPWSRPVCRGIRTLSVPSVSVGQLVIEVMSPCR